MPDSLDHRFRHGFLASLEGAENLDEVLPATERSADKIADFLLDNRQIILEVKSLESDPTYKIEEHLDRHRASPEFPLFYWQADTEEIFPYLPDGDKVRAKLFHALTRSIQGALEKADDQISATKARLGLHDACGVVAILNERIDILQITYGLAKANQILLKKKDGSIRYRNIAYVWFLSETHLIEMGDGTRALPMILLEGPTASLFPRVAEIIERIGAQWAEFNGAPFRQTEGMVNLENLKFTQRSNKPSNQDGARLTRSDFWRREYRAAPYLRNLSDEDFLSHAGRVISALARHFRKGRAKLPEDAALEYMRAWAHALEEAEHRRLDMKRLQPYLDSGL